MTRLNLSVLWVVVSASVASVALAQAPPAKSPGPGGAAVAPVPVRPSPQVETFFKAWEGEWKCDSALLAGALGPGKAAATTKATFNVRRETTGFWYRGEYAREGTKTVPPIQAVMVVGYDAGTKAPFGFRYDNWGTVALETTAGATPEKQVFVGDAHMTGAPGMKAKFRDTMTLKSQSEMEHAFEMDTGKGFQLMATDVCRK
jgi:hypothetical protein